MPHAAPGLQACPQTNFDGTRTAQLPSVPTVASHRYEAICSDCAGLLQQQRDDAGRQRRETIAASKHRAHKLRELFRATASPRAGDSRARAKLSGSARMRRTVDAHFLDGAVLGIAGCGQATVCLSSDATASMRHGALVRRRQLDSASRRRGSTMLRPNDVVHDVAQIRRSSRCRTSRCPKPNEAHDHDRKEQQCLLERIARL